MKLAALLVMAAVATGTAGINFSLPLFDMAGRRTHLLRGSEARYLGDENIEVTNMNLTLFRNAPENEVDAVLLSPRARFHVPTHEVEGDAGVRLVSDEFEASGNTWSYLDGEKRISIEGEVRVVIRAELQSILQ
jgi:hypothetical protein